MFIHLPPYTPSAVPRWRTDTPYLEDIEKTLFLTELKPPQQIQILAQPVSCLPEGKLTKHFDACLIMPACMDLICIASE